MEHPLLSFCRSSLKPSFDWTSWPTSIPHVLYSWLVVILLIIFGRLATKP